MGSSGAPGGLPGERCAGADPDSSVRVWESGADGGFFLSFRKDLTSSAFRGVDLSSNVKQMTGDVFSYTKFKTILICLMHLHM